MSQKIEQWMPIAREIVAGTYMPVVPREKLWDREFEAKVLAEWLASHAPSASPDICEKCGQEVIDGHWSLVCHKPACIKALQEGEVSMSYDLPIKRCFNLEDHPEHSWECKNELHKCPGMPIQPSEAAAQPTKKYDRKQVPELTISDEIRLGMRKLCGHIAVCDCQNGIFQPEIEHNDH